jgi:hypothetical protein
MVGHATLWVALAALAIFCFVKASRAGRDVVDDQQLPRLDRQTEYAMCGPWVALGTVVGVFLFIDAFFFINPAPSSLNAVSNR